ncbi:MAG: VOC family protein [Planctomycetota bacterium]
MTDAPNPAPGTFCWVDIAAHDAERAQAFYKTLFGWDAVKAPDGGLPYWMFEKGGRQVAGLGQMTPEMIGQGIPSVWNVYVYSNDVDATLAKAESLGATTIVPAMDAGGQGRLAFFADPAGAVLALWQNFGEGGAAPSGEDGTMCWPELATRDLASVESFYSELFGWKLTEQSESPMPYRRIGVGGNDVGGMMQMNEDLPAEVPPHWKMYFSVADVHQSVETIKAAGGKVHFGPYETPFGPIAAVEDDQGTNFSLTAVPSRG